MGHYASEMGHGAEPKPPSVEELEKVENERAEHREYLWNLFTQYRYKGIYSSSSEPLICPQCGAQVHYGDMVKHERWHVQLDTKLIMGPGLIA